jgi:hypothetical protein
MIKKSFIKRVIKLSGSSKGITLADDLGLVVGKAYQFHVEVSEE